MEGSFFDLSGKTAIITGGAGLLGKEHSLALGKQGCKVWLTDLDLKKCNSIVDELLAEGIDCEAYVLDVTQKESWIDLIKTIKASSSNVDILVNNASFTNQSKMEGFDVEFEDFSQQAWSKMMEVNLTGAFLGCQVVGKEMLLQKSGSIINIASLYGVVSPNHKMYPGTGIKQPVAYSVSKHGIVALTKYLGALWADKGVRVNAITPGGIFNGHEEPFLSRFNQLNPSGRMGDKSELRGGIVYLASDESKYVVGHNLIIDGGWSIW